MERTPLKLAWDEATRLARGRANVAHDGLVIAPFYLTVTRFDEAQSSHFATLSDHP